MVKYASEILVHIIKLSRKILRGTGRDFLLDVVFRDMVTGVSSAGLFAVGIPSEFHTVKNYFFLFCHFYLSSEIYMDIILFWNWNWKLSLNFDWNWNWASLIVYWI